MSSCTNQPVFIFFLLTSSSMEEAEGDSKLGDGFLFPRGTDVNDGTVSGPYNPFALSMVCYFFVFSCLTWPIVQGNTKKH